MNMKCKMKRLILVAACLGMLLILPVRVQAAGVKVNSDTFPSDVFRSFVLKNYDTDQNGLLSDEELAGVTAMDLSQTEACGDLTGLEYFTSLLGLDCSNQNLVTLNVSGNQKLIAILCNSNQLSSLDVSGNAELIVLYCNSNQLSSLDVSGNAELSELYCNSNQLSNLDVSENAKLSELWCQSNQLSSLDVSGNPELSVLSCDSNQLTSLDVSENPELSELSCSYNQLSSLDVRGNAKLSKLWCYSNQLSLLDVSRNPELSLLQCGSNQLSSLDVSGNTKLLTFNCNNNTRKLSGIEIDMSKIPGFEMEKASQWKNATVNGTKVVALDSSKDITYTYDCGQGHLETFYLKPVPKPSPWSGSLAKWQKNVTVKIAGANKVKLRWTKLAGAKSYQIYRSTYSWGGYKRIKTVKGSATSYTVKGLKKNTVYYFKIGVKASLQNQTLTDETLIVSKTVLGKPAKLKLKASINGDILTLKWNKPSRGVKKVVVYRKVNGKPYKKYKTLSPKKTSLKISLKNYDKINQYLFCVRTYYQKDGVKIWGISSNPKKLH